MTWRDSEQSKEVPNASVVSLISISSQQSPAVRDVSERHHTRPMLELDSVHPEPDIPRFAPRCPACQRGRFGLPNGEAMRL